MEHEDNAHLDNYLQNSQNMQIASGGVGDIGGFVPGDGLVGNADANTVGGKFEKNEHDDDEEWKYIREVQQSEKQQQTLKNDVLDKDDVAFGENGVGQHEGNPFGSNDNFNINATGDGFSYSEVVSTGMNEELEIVKNDGDFSTTSNTTTSTATAAEEEGFEGANVLQVEMKIDSDIDQEQLQHLKGIEATDEFDEEEPSSLATNTTNGTSSLSENINQQQHQLQDDLLQQRHTFENDAPLEFEDKENTDPAALDHELHSPLNPDAKEFVPNFGSPTSPPASAVDFAYVGEPAEQQFHQEQAHPTAVPRHLMEVDEDDFVAQSPRKGYFSNMDTISIPGEVEFEHEAAKRPHELEEDENIGCDDSNAQEFGALEQQQSFANAQITLPLEPSEDTLDFQHQDSPASFIDHGPETSVDLDTDIDLQAADATKELLYVQNGEFEQTNQPIEEILNTVQTLPVEEDSNDNSADQDFIGDKELLNVEEKEHVSASPSVEEIMNLRNIEHTFDTGLDMNNAAHMTESFYMEHTSSEQPEAERELQSELLNNASLLGNAMDLGVSQLGNESSFDVEVQSPSDNPFDSEIPEQANTLEKHLLEETKEQLSLPAENVDTAIEEMEKLNLGDVIEEGISNEDGLLQTVEEVAQTATTIHENDSQPFNNTPHGDYSNDFAFNSYDQQPTQQHLDSYQNEQIQDIENEFQRQYNDQLLHSDEEKNTPAHQEQGIAVEPHLLENKAETAESSLFQFESDFDANPSANIVTELPASPPASPVNIEAEVPAAEPFAVADKAAEILEAAVPSAVESLIETNEAVFVKEAETLLSSEVLNDTPEQESLIANDTSAVEQFIPTDTTNAAIEQEKVPAFVEMDSQPLVSAEAANDSQPLVSAEAANDSESLLVTDEPALTKEAENVVATDEPALTKETENAIATAAAVAGATAVAGMVAGVVATKKNEIAKPKSSTALKSATTNKPKVGDIKKPITEAKKPATTSKTAAPATARPRTAPAKTSSVSSVAEKKTLSSTTAAKAPIRKPLSATTSAAKMTTAGKPSPTSTVKSSVSSSSVTTARRSIGVTKAPATARPATATSSTTTVRKSPTGTTSATASKPRTTLQPTKPTTLGISGPASKTKLLSPRSTLTSQLRNTAKSPSKATAPSTNGVAANKSSITSTTVMKTKTTVGGSTTTTTTTTTKTFTARPAPKSTSSSYSATALTRRTLPVTSTVKKSTSSTVSSSLKKSPMQSKSTTSGVLGNKTTPTRSSASSTLKLKAKDANSNKAPSPAALKSKPAPIRKPEPKLNGVATENVAVESNNIQVNGVELEKIDNETKDVPEVLNGGGSGDDGLQQEQHAAAEVSLIDA